MVDLNKIKERIESQSKKAGGGGKRFDDKPTVFFKATQLGKHKFRCVPYPHVEDSESEPFAERHYHFNIPGHYAIYCPEKNDRKKCAVCDFVWSNMKALKGTSDKKLMDEWRDRLPQLQIMIPGKLVSIKDESGKETEVASEMKFLKFRSDYDKMSENHKKLIECFSEEPNWLDWKDGFTLEMDYEAPKGEQKERFKNATAMLARGSLKLSRHKSQGFDNKKDYEQFVASIPDLDKLDPFDKKTSEDMVAALEKWQKKAEQKANNIRTEMGAASKVSDEIVVGTEVKDSGSMSEAAEVPEKKVSKPNEVKLSKLEEKLRSLGVGVKS